MSVLISVPIGMAISQYSNLNHACANKTCVYALTMMDGFVMTISYIMQRTLDLAGVNVTYNIDLI